jgi:hypothetical protein
MNSVTVEHLCHAPKCVNTWSEKYSTSRYVHSRTGLEMLSITFAASSRYDMIGNPPSRAILAMLEGFEDEVSGRFSLVGLVLCLCQLAIKSIDIRVDGFGGNLTAARSLSLCNRRTRCDSRQCRHRRRTRGRRARRRYGYTRLRLSFGCTRFRHRLIIINCFPPRLIIIQCSKW